MKKLTRICICPKDIQLLTGKSERQARRILNNVKKQLGKSQDQFVTIKEFCQAKGLPFETVIALLQD